MMLEPEEMVALACVISNSLKKKKRKRKRTLWVHPILSSRQEKGIFYTLFNELLQDEKKFFNYFRMSISSFYELYEKLRIPLTFQDTNMRKCIPGIERLAVTIRYLAVGCYFSEMFYNYRIGVSTISEIVHYTCILIWNLRSEWIPLPTEEKFREIAEGYKRNANYPHCIGALDGKHVRIIKPANSGSLYYNYKKYCSIVLLAACDSNYLFTYVDIGSYGKDSDSGIFQESDLWREIQSNTLNIPASAAVGSNQNKKMPFVFVGDEAFGLSKHVMRPYSGKNLSVKKRVFNYRLSRARRHIECTFGILSNKWHIFHRPINVKVDLAQYIIKACVVLHNFVRTRDGFNFDDTLTCPGLLDIPDEPDDSNRRVQPIKIRELFADYFVGEGSLPWQYTRI